MEKEFNTQLKELRKSVEKAIFMEVQNTKNRKIRFTEDEAPRFYYDGGWREIICVQTGFMSTGSCQYGWHDERCTAKGPNAFTYASSISVDILVSIYELISSKKDK